MDWHTFLAAKHIITVEAGAVVLDESSLLLQPHEVQRRLMVKALCWVSEKTYAPRRGALAGVMASLRQGQAGTINGCHIRRIGARIWVFREFNAVQTVETPTDVQWDNRWCLIPCAPERHAPDLKVRALGFAGLQQCPDWRATGLPHVVLQSTPGVWRQDELIAAPVAGHPQNWRANLGDGPDTFFAALLSH